MLSLIERVDSALKYLKAGKMVILTDDPDRENEGDFVIAAEKITAEQMNFIIRNGSGIVCVSMTSQHLAALHLPLMVATEENNPLRGTAFTVSVDARSGISSGVSVADRVKTIHALMADGAKPEHFVKPGHIFPLMAAEGGVFERQGHTEGSLDLVRMAGLKPAAVLCELMNADGSMTTGKALIQFAADHQIAVVSIRDVIAYRKATARGA